MGWISERHMRRGGSLYSGGPKRKGPLKIIVGHIAGDYSTNMFGSDVVLLECGHIGRSYGGKRSVCTKCKDGLPMDIENHWEIDVLATLEKYKREHKQS